MFAFTGAVCQWLGGQAVPQVPNGPLTPPLGRDPLRRKTPNTPNTHNGK